MAYAPVSGTVPQYQVDGDTIAAGFYLKGYTTGTTTPLSMATDLDGGTLLAKCKLNTAGYPLSNEADNTTVFIPHFNATYKLALYVNATDADNNTTANAVWVVDKLPHESANFLSVKDKGAIGDGIADDTTAINDGIVALDALGGGTLFYPDGTYAVSGALNLRDNVKHIGEGPTRSIIKPTAAFTELFSGSGVPNTGQSNTLASNAAAGALTLTLSSGKGANFTAGDYAIIIDDGSAPGGSSLKQGEIIRVQSMATDVMTLSSPLQFGSYTTANSAQVQNVNWLEGQHFEGLAMDGNNYLSNRFIDLSWAMRPVIKNVDSYELPGTGISLAACYHTRISDIFARDYLSDSVFGETSKFGYVIVEGGMCQGLNANAVTVDSVRHGYTTADSLGGMTHGVPLNSVISNGVASNCRGAGWDTHEPGVGIEFNNCIVNGSMGGGFQLRSLRTKIVGGSANSCLGPGLLLSSAAKDCDVGSFDYYRCNLGTSPVDNIDWTEQGCIYDNGEKNTVHDGKVDSCGGPGIELPSGNDDGTYRNIKIKDPLQLASTETAGFLADSAGPVTTTLDNIDIEDTGTNMTDGFEFNAGTITNGLIRNCRSRGHSGDQYNISGDTIFVNQPQGGMFRGIGVEDTITVATLTHATMDGTP